MTPQERMRKILEAIQIPQKRIEVYGQQIVITCFSRKAAEEWFTVVAKFAHARGIVDTFDDAVVNKNTVLRPSKVKVSRVFARI